MSTDAPTWQHSGYVAVLQLVTARAGLQPPSCPASAMEGIQRAMARADLTGEFATYLERLAVKPALLDDLLVELTVGETYFFRNPEHFQFVRHTVLPAVRRRRGREHLMRAWSAGCSSGEEPYSLAVLLQEEGYGDQMAVWATDVSRAALARSREGIYGDWSLRGPEAERIRPFLHTEGRRHTLSAELRGRVHFDYLNLAEDTWPSRAHGLWGMDVIFCRNVLIYFTRPTVEAVARRLFATLAEGGFLITGPSDPPLNGLAPFETLVFDWGIAYHRPAPGHPPQHLGPRSILGAEPSEPLPPWGRGLMRWAGPLFFVTLAWIPLLNQSRFGDLASWYTDHLHHPHATWVFFSRGVELYTRPFSEIRAGTSWPYPNEAWGFMPGFAYPPGVVGVFLPITLLGRFGGLSAHAFGIASVLFLLGGSAWAFHQAVHALALLPRGSRAATLAYPTGGVFAVWKGGMGGSG